MKAEIICKGMENGVPLIFPADSSNPHILTSEMVTELIEHGRLERERRSLSFSSLDSEKRRNCLMQYGFSTIRSFAPG
jgi:hypothetical protein